MVSIVEEFLLSLHKSKENLTSVSPPPFVLVIKRFYPPFFTMKTLPLPSRILAVALFFSVVLQSCKHQTGEDPDPQGNCRLLNYSYSYGQPGGNQPFQKEKATYTYDAEGRLLKADTVITALNVYKQGVYENRVSENQRFTSTYTYDAEGFLTRYASVQKSQWDEPHWPNQIRDRTHTIDFTYEDGKLKSFLSRHENVSAPNKGLITTVQSSFTYGEDGKLTKRIDKTRYNAYDPAQVPERPAYPNGFENTFVYADGKLVDMIQNVGNGDTHPATIQNGLVVRSGNANNYTTIEFDSQERPFKTTHYTNNAINSYYTQEWVDGKSASAALPRFKGFPEVKPSGGYSDGALHKFTFYHEWNPGEGIKLVSEFTHHFQFNGRGYVTSQSTDIKGTEGNKYVSTPAKAPILYSYDCP